MEGLKKDLHLKPQAFVMMENLKLLRFDAIYDVEPKHMVYVPKDIILPDKLRFFHWNFYLSKSISLISCVDNLVELCMKNSRLQKLWDGIQVFILFAYVARMMC